jgi:hypothetical protein
MFNVVIRSQPPHRLQIPNELCPFHHFSLTTLGLHQTVFPLAFCRPHNCNAQPHPLTLSPFCFKGWETNMTVIPSLTSPLCPSQSHPSHSSLIRLLCFFSPSISQFLSAENIPLSSFVFLCWICQLIFMEESGKLHSPPSIYVSRSNRLLW